MNHWGRIFSVSIFGESHGAGVGVTISGCPAGISLKLKDFEADLSRRKSGAKGTTPRIESDKPQLLSGVFEDKTTGAPLTVWFENRDSKSKDYATVIKQPRPGHADFVAKQKFAGFNDYRGGGHFSGRLTLALVVAGVIAKKIVSEVEIDAFIESIKGRTDFDEIIEEALAKQDSVGGLVRCEAKNIPVGWGEPFYDSIESVISHLAFAIPAIKGIEFGNGFSCTELWGSEHNDLIINEKGETETNNSGGVSGGITNANTLTFKVAVKPTSSIGKEQNTMNFEEGRIKPLIIKGRHDACIALRVPVVLEAITAMALADFKLIRKTQTQPNK
ncbi:chorismate synthase [Balneicella halophila]|uniref:Chorismate synthase n=1 Tax=Balneicella halophila TaxID=1537566 RepID=A0A7L4UMQ3_BALHA|nr:chorismate synthase [Balneicella halophila]PVX49901.1 chorismate synthase [Balneicella halophila]